MDDAPILLADYDPTWPARFEAERALLEEALAPWLTGPVAHVGSTAVPGMTAKPIIDLMGPVGSLDASRDAIEAATALAYLYAPYRADEMHWFCKPSPAVRTHHLHLVPSGSRTWRARLAFRDALRDDASLAADYLALKRDLAARFPRDRDAYTDGKTSFISDVLDTLEF